MSDPFSPEWFEKALAAIGVTRSMDHPPPQTPSERMAMVERLRPYISEGQARMLLEEPPAIIPALTPPERQNNGGEP